MAELSGLAALAANPKVAAVLTAIQVGGGIIDSIRGSKTDDIVNDILNRRRDRAEELALNAKGQFTPAQRKSIERNYEPAVNRVAQGVAARGLYTDPAGQKTIADAQLQPFFHEADRAAALLDQADAQTLQVVQYLESKQKKIAPVIGSIMSKLTTLRGLDQSSASQQSYLKVLDDIFGAIDKRNSAETSIGAKGSARVM